MRHVCGSFIKIYALLLVQIILFVFSGMAYAGFMIPGKAKPSFGNKETKLVVKEDKKAIITIAPIKKKIEVIKKEIETAKIEIAKEEESQKLKKDIPKISKKTLFYKTRTYVLNLPFPIHTSVPSNVSSYSPFVSKLKPANDIADIPEAKDYIKYTALPVLPIFIPEKLLEPTAFLASEKFIQKVFPIDYKQKIIIIQEPKDPSPYIFLTENDLKFISALVDYRLNKFQSTINILYAIKNYSDTYGKKKAMVFAALAMSRINLFETATYTALNYIESENSLAKYTKTAIDIISTSLAKIHSPTTVLSSLVRLENKIPDKNSESFKNIVYHQNLKGIKKDFNCINEQNPKDETSLKCKFIKAIHLFEKKDIANAGLLFKEISETTKNEKLKAVANANAGRIKFIENQFKEATSVYKHIPQTSTHWLDSSVELAWAQLRDNDPESTIGNLNILHQQFAKNALLTESYTIKALAYQQICQFGDAINAIKFGDLLYKKSYDWLKGINSNKSTSYYKTIADALRGKVQAPTQAIIELARNKKFLNAQERINGILKEQKTTKSLAVGPSIDKDTSNYFINETRLESVQAESAIKQHALDIEDSMKNLFANNAILEYEIYAAAATNIEIHNAKQFKDINTDKGKMNELLKSGREAWPVESEIWEDELNNFRTKLINLCAKK